MPATPAQALTNLLTELSRIFGNIVGAFGGVLQAFVALFWTVAQSIVAIGSALATTAIDLANDTVGFIWGNIFILAVLGIGYYFWSQRQPQSRNRRVTRKK
ncbi:hypothetical protein EXIGLDRAFT_832999 [Exidia glandulosa HHB12029]|uniref:Uncharacterized protein n=1 Tax=Exidia glandulosa HHB12029 TaxID=1314781 RepID=A0A165L3I3_EXIGL|nr:hypothetical protein EXIGLDRAFT_832999 [Exidia glandulosa HHB12029]